MHERLKNSQHRTQLENHVRKIIQQNGGVDSVNLETLVEQLRGKCHIVDELLTQEPERYIIQSLLPIGCLPSIQEASGPVIESIIEFTQAQANKET